MAVLPETAAAWLEITGTGDFKMCSVILANGSFDASACPLLRGLSPEEIEQRLHSDKRIQACMASLNTGVAPEDPKVARLLDSYCGQTGRARHRDDACLHHPAEVTAA